MKSDSIAGIGNSNLRTTLPNHHETSRPWRSHRDVWSTKCWRQRCCSASSLRRIPAQCLVVAAFCCTLLHFGDVAPASDCIVHIQPTSLDPIDRSSSGCKTLVLSAREKWKSGDTTGSNKLLFDYATTAPAAGAAAAKLRLAYQLNAEGRKDEAKQRFAEAASVSNGVNDAIKGEAAFRLAHLEPEEKRREIYEQIIAGQIPATNYDACEAALLVGKMDHKNLELRRSVQYYEAVSTSTANPKQKAQALVEAAGLWFEIAKGEGKDQIEPKERGLAFDRARELCQQVKAMGDQAPASRRMVADLMHFETYRFQDRYDMSCAQGQTFMATWGSDPKPYQTNERRYMNAARLFQMKNLYVTSRTSEALELAKEIVDDPPAEDEQFPSANTYLYASVIGKLISEEMSDPEAAADFEQHGRSFNSEYFDMLAPGVRQERQRHVGGAQ